MYINIYKYIYTYVYLLDIFCYTCRWSEYVYIYICIYEELRPLPPAPRLEDPMAGRIDDSMDG